MFGTMHSMGTEDVWFIHANCEDIEQTHLEQGLISTIGLKRCQ